MTTKTSTPQQPKTTQPTKKYGAFMTGLRTVVLKTRPARWRSLYRTMHAMDTTQKMGDIPALYQITKLSLLQYQYGRKMKKIAKTLTDNIIKSILENDDDLSALNLRLLTRTEKQEFIIRTINSTHKKMSEIVPDAAPLLKNVVLDTEYNKKPEKRKRPALAYYSSQNYQIGICPELLKYNDMDFIASVIAHEYVHVLQAAYSSSLPTPIIRFLRQHTRAKMRLSHDLRPNEQEALKIDDIVQRRFNERYLELADIYYSEHD